MALFTCMPSFLRSNVSLAICLSDHPYFWCILPFALYRQLNSLFPLACPTYFALLQERNIGNWIHFFTLLARLHHQKGIIWNTNLLCIHCFLSLQAYLPDCLAPKKTTHMVWREITMACSHFFGPTFMSRPCSQFWCCHNKSTGEHFNQQVSLERTHQEELILRYGQLKNRHRIYATIPVETT